MPRSAANPLFPRATAGTPWQSPPVGRKSKDEMTYAHVHLGPDDPLTGGVTALGYYVEMAGATIHFPDPEAFLAAVTAAIQQISDAQASEVEPAR